MPSQSYPFVWLGLIEGASGYADEARGFLRALEAAGDAPAARHLFGSVLDAKLSSQDRVMLRRQFGRPADGGAVAVHHYAPAWRRQPPRLPGIPNVARTMFETDRVPAAWIPQLLGRDQVWVPCAHNLEAFERGGVPSNRLRVVGETIDFDLFAPGAEPLELGTPNGHFVFLSNLEFSERKAWRQLLSAWVRAFASTDPVYLVLKTTNDPDGSLGRRVRDAVAAAIRANGRTAAAPVHLLSHTLSPPDLVRMYAAADAYVLASRGEGWGRPYMEALAMGLPTIASRWSGPLEFMRDEHSWLVDGRLVPVPRDHGVFADDVSAHRWFEPDVDALSAALTDVASNPARSRARAANARSDIIARFGPEAIVERLRTVARELVQHDASLSGRCAIRGTFGRNASLSIVNDTLLAELEGAGRRVHARAEGAPAEPGLGPSISHSWPPDFSPGSDGPSVLILPWEFGHPPVDWVEQVRAGVDRVLVPSDYVRRGFIAGGMPPGVIEVVPNGVDLERFRPDGPARTLAETASCVFLFVGGTILRKGVDLLLTAWELAFTAADDVLLVVKDFGTQTHYRGQTHGEAVRALAARDDVAPILYVPDEVPADELPLLYRAADVLVAPYRGEGFGLPILEGMACGVPAIHTAEGPSSEFVGDGGWAVPAGRVQLLGPIGTLTLAGNGYVHEVEVPALVEALRRAAAYPDDRRRRGTAALRQARQYSWQRATSLVERTLTTLEHERLPPAREIHPAHVASRRHTVLYAAPWHDEDAWSATLRRWIETIPADADVTLAMPVRIEKSEAVMGRVMRRLQESGADLDRLPDLALHQQVDDDPAALVAMADAVLLDAKQAVEQPPAVCRRALRLIEAHSGELEQYAATLELINEPGAEAA